MARGIRTALKTYRSGAVFVTARRNVLTVVSGSFGINFLPVAHHPTDVPAGEPGYDAPSNVGIMIIGWLYSEDDFGKSLCIANNCGEDTDCTCATLGAILGIIHGAKGIPQGWTESLGDRISTYWINLLDGGVSIPTTVSELTERVLRLTPLFRGRDWCDILAGPDGYTIETRKPKALFCPRSSPISLEVPATLN